jgi:hypothetical protein
MEFQANLANAQNQNAGLSGLYTGLGTIAGFALGPISNGLTSVFSSSASSPLDTKSYAIH